MTTTHLSFVNIAKIDTEYSEDIRNQSAINDLNAAKDPLKSSAVLNCVLSGMMVVSFIISAFTLGKNLRSKEHKVGED